MSIIADSNFYSISSYGIHEFISIDKDYALYLYVKATIGESPLLHVTKSNMPQEIENSFKIIEVIKQQYEKEIHEHSN